MLLCPISRATLPATNWLPVPKANRTFNSPVALVNPAGFSSVVTLRGKTPRNHQPKSYGLHYPTSTVCSTICRKSDFYKYRHNSARRCGHFLWYEKRSHQATFGKICILVGSGYSTRVNRSVELLFHALSERVDPEMPCSSLTKRNGTQFFLWYPHGFW